VVHFQYRKPAPSPHSGGRILGLQILDFRFQIQ
jgi:hypothetical protein